MKPQVPFRSRQVSESELPALLTELGTPLVEYSPSWKPGLIWIGAGLGIAALAFAVLGVSERASNVMLMLGILVIVIGILMTLSSLFEESYKVCPAGFVVLRWGRADVCRWNEVAYLRLLTKKQYSYGTAIDSENQASIVRSDGRRFTLRYLSVQLAAFINDATLSVWLPVVRAQLAAGHRVEFGDLSMGPEGLYHRKRSIPWRDLQGVEIRERVVLRLKDHSTVWIGDVANVDLLIALVRERVTPDPEKAPAIT